MDEFFAALREKRAPNARRQHRRIRICEAAWLRDHRRSREPREPLYLAGAKLVSNYGLGPIFDGIGLIHPVLSYDDSITIAFTSCPSMIREPALYTECLRGEFEALRMAVDSLGIAHSEPNVVDLRRNTAA